MINCRKCDFHVIGSMRHALVENCCPSCGAAILGNVHTQRLRLLKQRLIEQEFAQSLGNELVFDISLFMLLEFFPTDLEEKRVDAEEEKRVDAEEGSETYAEIRSEVREEMLSKMEDDLEDIDEDLKVARLKRLAKESRLLSTGPAVRRVNSD